MYLRIHCKLSKYYLWTVVYLLNRDNFGERFIELREFDISEFGLNVFGFVIGTVIFYVSGSMFDKRNLFETNNRVISNEQIFKNVHSIRIKLARGLSFKPGQYVNLFVDTEKKPYTPIKYNNDILTFLIKSYDKRFSNKLTD